MVGGAEEEYLLQSISGTLATTCGLGMGGRV